jgi:hypothetical protein
MKRMLSFPALLSALALIGLFQSARAQVPARISFQGLTLDQHGQTLPDGHYQVTFRLFDNPDSGDPLWSETQSVNVHDGLLSTLVGLERALTLPFDKPYFLSLEVDGQPESQRIALSAAPYALLARDVPDSTVVRSISGMKDNIELIAGEGISIDQRDNRLIISAHGDGLKNYGPAETPNAAPNATPAAKKLTDKLTGPLTLAQDIQRNDDLLATLGPGGSNVGLDAAYDVGRAITVDGGGVIVDGTGIGGVGLDVSNTDMLFRHNTGTTGPSFRFSVPGQIWQMFLNPAAGDLRFVNNTSATTPFRMLKTATNTLLTLDGSALKIRNAAGVVKVTIDSDVSGDGRVITEELEITGGSDLSELFDVSAGVGEAVAPGMVVSIDPANPGRLSVSGTAYDRMVAGVVSGAGGIETGLLMGQRGSEADGSLPVALTGRVYVWVDASYGSVTPGDLLTTSSTAGHAMKVSDYARSQGAILGKAMTSLGEGKGLVLMLVSLQ